MSEQATFEATQATPGDGGEWGRDQPTAPAPAAATPGVISPGQAAESPADRAGAPPVATIPTRAQAKQKRQEESQIGVEFPLPVTGGFARVRKLHIQDRVVLAKLPKSAQDILANELLRADPAKRRQVEKPDAFANLLDAAEHEEQLADAFCVMGFIEPRLVATPDEVNEADPYSMWVGDLHMQERRAYLVMCMAEEVAEARSLTRFPR